MGIVTLVANIAAHCCNLRGSSPDPPCHDLSNLLTVQRTSHTGESCTSSVGAMVTHSERALPKLRVASNYHYRQRRKRRRIVEETNFYNNFRWGPALAPQREAYLQANVESVGFTGDGPSNTPKMTNAEPRVLPIDQDVVNTRSKSSRRGRSKRTYLWLCRKSNAYMNVLMALQDRSLSYQGSRTKSIGLRLFSKVYYTQTRLNEIQDRRDHTTPVVKALSHLIVRRPDMGKSDLICHPVLAAMLAQPRLFSFLEHYLAFNGDKLTLRQGIVTYRGIQLLRGAIRL
jgi:hypothetical protein